LEKCKNYNRPIRIIYFDADVHTRIQRMMNRGDNDSQIVSRLLTDEKDDWHKQLDSLVWHYANNEHMNIVLHKVDANNMLSDVLSQVVYYMNKLRRNNT
jgi:dephospho-CoA kinase